MSLPKSSTKKYSASSMAAGAVFCPACRKRISDRDALICPSCGFAGEDTMKLFPYTPPPLEVLSDHAEIFSETDKTVILRRIRKIRRRFPQIHWCITTANLGEDENVGLFSFWLLNVSPLGPEEDPATRPWTVLLVILPDGSVAATPGYAAEVWLSGHDWARLLRDLHGDLVQQKYGNSIRDFLDQCDEMLESAWLVAEERTHPNAVVNRSRS